MEQIRNRKVWLLLIVVAAGAAAILGGQWLFSDAACQRLQLLLLYAATLVAGAVAILYALVARNDSPFAQLLTCGAVFAVGLVVPAVGGVFAAQSPDVRGVFCASCDETVATARKLRLEGQLSGAEHLVRQCYAQGEDDYSRSACGCELAHVLYDMADVLMDEDNCDGAEAALYEARTLADNCATELGFPGLVDERERYWQLLCATPDPTPTPSDLVVEVLREQQSGGRVTIDVRVLQNDSQLAGLTQGDFSLTAGKTIPILSFEERGSDDPVCLVVVIDNSGSVYPGLNQIRQALVSLNSKRKSDDELGLVVFADRGAVDVVQVPTRGSLDPRVITGMGEMTALWDGVLKGLETARACTTGVQYLLVLTDGADNDSVQIGGDSLFQAGQIAVRAEEEDIGICTVGVESEQLDTAPLRRVAQGCRYNHAADFDALVSLFQEIFGFVRDFYRIQFSLDSIPAEQSVTLHVLGTVAVEVDCDG